MSAVNKNIYKNIHDVYLPVRVIRQYNERLVSAADVPEPRLTVVSTAGQVVLLVGVEIQVSH